MEILNNLGIDASAFIQFAIFIALYIFLSQVYFKQILRVLKYREQKTTKLLGESEHLLEKAAKTQTEYEKMTKEIYLAIEKSSEEKKSKIREEKNEKIKSNFDQLNKDYKEKIKLFEEDLAQQKKQILLQADGLSEDLVRKLT